MTFFRKFCFSEENFLLAAIISLGAALRFFQLGEKSFWNDEAGVALVALSDKWQQVFQGVRAHAMAMPLDYVIIWITAQFGKSEFLLRLPAAMFGTLTLIIIYLFLVRITPKSAAILAALWLAISPLHIHYSQELRFYGALIFFYLLCSVLLWIAVENNHLRWWAFYIFATSAGIYFHIYVILAHINGIFWIILKNKDRDTRSSRTAAYLLSGLLLLLILIPGFLYYGSGQKFSYSLLPWGTSFLQEIGEGMGWLGLPYGPGTPAVQLWYVLTLFFAVVGLASVIHRKTWTVLALILSAITQIGLILAADLYKGYWFNYRQILHLLPFSCMLASLGLWSLLTWFHLSGARFKIVTFIAIALLVLSSIPALVQYYRWPKSNAHQISEQIAVVWQPGAIIYIYPGYHEKVFRWYFQTELLRPEMIASITPVELDGLEKSNPQPALLVYFTPFPVNGQVEVSRILQNGFKPMSKPLYNCWLCQTLFSQENSSVP
jgi:uncharacterized membrane protein